MDKQLRLFAGTIIVESKLPKDVKLKLLEWVKKQATDSEVKALLMDGKAISVLKEDESFINERFENHLIYENLNEGIVKTIAGMVLLGGPQFWAIYRAIRATVDKKSAQCGIFGVGKKRDICLLKVKADEQNKLAQFQLKALAECKKQKNPQDCERKVKESSDKFKQKAQKYLNKINKYAAKSPKKGLKAQQGLEKAADPKDKLI